MGQYRGILTPEERARIMELQDLLIERLVEHREAVAEGQEERVKTAESEIDNLLREKEEIEKWAAVGSASPPQQRRSDLSPTPSHFDRGGMRQNLVLDAQVYLVPFYEGLGFAVTSNPYDDFGVPHVAMIAPTLE